MNNSTNPNPQKTVQLSQILGVLLIIGDPDFLKSCSKDDALSLAIDLYKKWNTNWSGEGKFPITTGFTSHIVPTNATGIAELCKFARETTFSVSFENHSLFIQPIILTRVNESIHQNQQIQACLVTLMRIPSTERKSLVIVNGSLDFIS